MKVEADKTVNLKQIIIIKNKLCLVLVTLRCINSSIICTATFSFVNAWSYLISFQRTLSPRLKLHALTWVVVPGPDVVLPEPGVRDPGVHPAAGEAVGGGEDPVGGDEGAAAHHGEGGGPVAGAQDGRPRPVANVGDLVEIKKNNCVN